MRSVHQPLPEYSAANQMGEDMRRGVPVTKYWPGERWWEPTGWEEAVLLLAGTESECTAVVRWLAPVHPTLAYRCAMESGTPCPEDALRPLFDPPVPPIPKYEKGDEVDRWRGSLPRIAPLARAEWGRVLAERGDTRRGVGLRADGLPDIDWVEVPAGPYLMGSTDKHVAELKSKYDWDWPENEKPQLTVTLPTLYIARYPVTYAQYEVFVNEGGYAFDSYWTSSGLEWRGAGRQPRAFWSDPQCHISNHPIVGVTWYEAYAFTQWLSARLGYAVSLPTEQQWEKAARGTDGRIYPWGDTYIPGFANVNETAPEVTVGPYYVQRTTAAGIYPQGASPYGVLDMSGNVWELCLTKWRGGYGRPESNDPEGTMMRIWRGGSWSDTVPYARCASRRKYFPFHWDADLGFRVCAGSRPT